MKYFGFRWLTGVYHRSVDLFEVGDLAPTTEPRIVQHQVLHPRGSLYGIATCLVVADDEGATLDYAPFPEANSAPEMLLGATRLQFERGDGQIRITKIMWRNPGAENFEDAEFEHYGVQSKIPEKRGIEAAQMFMLDGARKLSMEELEARLPEDGNLPAKISVATTAYIRSPYVIEAALRAAEGICHDCGCPGPFISSRTGEPYLEVHHVVPLWMGGADSRSNAIALCPNCHRKRHHA